MPYITPAQLAAILRESILLGPDVLETKQSFVSAGGTTVEEELDDLEVPEAQEVADCTVTDASAAYVEAELQAVIDTLADVVTALKELGLLVDPV